MEVLETIVIVLQDPYTGMEYKIKLTEEDYNEPLSVLTLLTNTMMEVDKLFDEMYQLPSYGGSYYDGLKITHPDEYDLDLLLVLPKAIIAEVKNSNVPGYVHVKFWEYIPRLRTHKGFQKLLDGNDYLDVERVKQWIESVLQRALNTFRTGRNTFILPTGCGDCLASTTKNGPAFTIHLKIKNQYFDVDLVPCFVFDGDQWPKEFRRNPYPERKPNFLVMPKNPKWIDNSNHYWRLSFQEQERLLIKDKRNLKPTIKLLKKLRDNNEDVAIASYYIKTVALWTMEEAQDLKFWNNSLSFSFMTVLKNYQKFLKNGEIPYYWYPSHKFLKDIDPKTVENICNRITKIIDDIESNLGEDPGVIAKYI